MEHLLSCLEVSFPKKWYLSAWPKDISFPPLEWHKEGPNGGPCSIRQTKLTQVSSQMLWNKGVIGVMAQKIVRQDLHVKPKEDCCFCLVAKLCPTLLWSIGLKPTQLLCPWDFPGQNTGVGSISFSRGSSWPKDQTHIFRTGNCIICHWANREA